MKRRELMAGSAGTLTLSLLLPGRAFSQELYKEGVHYERLPQKVPTSNPDKIEVAEVFWYGCPHCFKFEPQVESWLQNKPDNVEFVQVPGVGGRWTLGAAAFYVGQKLGVLEKTHKAMFDAIHVQRKKMDSLDEIAGLYAEHGVDRETFDKALNSFEVKSNIQRAQELMKRYQVTGVPALIVNGQYKTNALPVVDYLVHKEGSS